MIVQKGNDETKIEGKEEQNTKVLVECYIKTKVPTILLINPN